MALYVLCVPTILKAVAVLIRMSKKRQMAVVDAA